MPRPCSICSHPNLRDIDTVLAAGATELAIVSQFGVGRGSVGRHRRDHLAPIIAAAAHVLGADRPAKLARAQAVCVFTHPRDETAHGFYARWGFQDLPFDPRRAMIVRMVDLERSFLEW